MIFAGIDAGSRTVKAVLIDGKTLKMIASGMADQGVKQAALAKSLLMRVSRQAGIGAGDITGTVATGYGRNALDIAGTTITEISCHARGVHHLRANARTIVDIGGQDSKFIRLDHDGRVRDFAMNDRCAAGTGRFLEIVAQRLEVSLTDIGNMARRTRKPAPISSTCAVFAETEIIGLLASGIARKNIAAGVQRAIAARVAAMTGGNVEEPVVFTGGVATVPGMEKALESALGHRVVVARLPFLTGALGAAILAAERHGRKTEEEKRMENGGGVETARLRPAVAGRSRGNLRSREARNENWRE